MDQGQSDVEQGGGVLNWDETAQQIIEPRRSLEEENALLKQLVLDLSLEKQR